MTITLDIPDEVAASLEHSGAPISRSVLEGFAVEAYRLGQLTAMQVRTLLGHGSRWETQDFLASHDAIRSLTVGEIMEDAEVAWAARKIS